MSYILDALRKAEAERQRGKPPNLHAPPLDALTLASGRPTGPGASRMRWAVIGAAALVVLGVVAVAVGLGLHKRLRPEAGSDRSAAPAVPAAATSSREAPAATPPVTPPVTPAVTPPVPPAALPAVPPAPLPVVPPSTATSPSTASPPRLENLPSELRSELPALTVSGAVHSSDPASRLLLLNGQVLRQGEALVPGLVLESLGPEGAVFSWRGQRFTLVLPP